MNTQAIEQQITKILNDILLHFREYYRLQAEASRLANPAPVADSLEDKRREALRAWRRERAITQSVAAFMILSNRTLDEIAKKAPQSIDELKEIYGMGATKTREYGEVILSTLGRVANTATISDRRN